MLRKTLKWGGLGLLGLLLVAVVFAAHSWYFKPVSIRIFYERVFAEYVFKDPELLTQLRLLDPLGIRGHNRKLTDSSPARQAWAQEKLKRDLDTLKSYDRASLSEDDRHSYDVLLHFLGTQVAGERWAFHNYPVNQLFGVQNNTPEFFATMHPVRDRRDAEDYVIRLGQIPVKFDQVLEGLKLREEKGIRPPRFVVEKVLTEMRAFRATAPEASVLYSRYAERLAELPAGTLDEATRTQLLDGVKQALSREVYPAYDRLIGWFEQLAQQELGNHGVWALPDGDAFYRYAIRAQTTTEMDPEALHRIGVEEVARIQAEMDTILRDAGYVEGTLAERIRALAESPEQLYPDSDEGRAAILADYQKIIDEISTQLDPYFSVMPAAAVKVERVPAFRETTAPGAYYQPPAMDGSRPGVFFANLRDVGEIPRFGMRTLAYHEAIPGHHFQIARMMELKGVPTFRRLLPFTAYSEGWALYTEQLAWEAGFQNNPLDNLGRLQAELFRAVRLVVDTGLHHQRWTREQAIDYMRDNTGMGEKEVTAEIERYLVMPGQALAYKVGMLKILELREKARAELGERFDIREFHDVVLGRGAMPLTLLEQQVEAWVAGKG